MERERERETGRGRDLGNNFGDHLENLKAKTPSEPHSNMNAVVSISTMCVCARARESCVCVHRTPANSGVAGILSDASKAHCDIARNVWVPVSHGFFVLAVVRYGPPV